MSGEVRYRRHDDILTGQADQEVFMMSLANERYYALNATGTRIWELVGEPRTVPEICEALQREYRVDPEAARAATIAFLQELLERNLIQQA